MIDQLVPHWWVVAAVIWAWGAACWFTVVEPGIEGRWRLALVLLAIAWPASMPFIIWHRDRAVERDRQRKLQLLRQMAGMAEFVKGKDNGKAD